jgi:parallel beta-helix repeat protein
VGREYWVSTTGNDADAGTREKPFATLQRARDALREAKKAGPLRAGATVWLSGGIYWMEKTFALDAQDSGTAEAPVVYRSALGRKAHLVGGKQLPSGAFKPVTNIAALKRLHPSAHGKVMQVDLKALGITDYGRLTRRGGIERNILPAALELFFNDRPMPLARWPNHGYVNIAAVPEGPKGERFVYEGDRPKRWSKADEIWVHGYFNRNWCDTYEKVASIDTAKREITTQEPHDYRGYKAGQRIRFLNLLEELDEAGEWYLDLNTETLYFWPPEPIEKGRVWVSLLETPLVVLRGTQHITLRDLILECTRGSGVEIVDGHHNLVAGCTLRNIGTVGVAIGGVVEDIERRLYRDTMFKPDAGTDNGIVSCDIYDTGECGVILAGGDRKTLEPGRNYAVNNRIYNFARWVRTYRPAVFLCGVGNRVAHNIMHDAPHTAVLFLGNEHVLEFNEIYRVCTESGDAGAFYTGRDWSQRGTVIRYNYFHDLRASLEGSSSSFSGVMGVYLDDQASGITVFGNIFSRVNRAIMLGGGRDNTIENNIFAFCGRAIHLDARGVSGTLSSSETLLDRLKEVNHDRPPYSERYPVLAKILDDEPGKPKGNVIARNICVGGPWDVFFLAADQQFVRALVKMEHNLTEGDSGLVAPEKEDFRLSNDSVALKLGFKPIPIEKIGLNNCR